MNPNLTEKAEVLVSYLQRLPGFAVVERNAYDHMGAIIVDAMLQAGATWEAVEERRDKVRGYEEAKTTSGFLALLNKQSSVSSFLDWSGRKPQWVMGLADFLKREGVETVSDFREWLRNDKNQERLLTLKGIRHKTRDYLIKLAGLQGIPIDRHWYKALDCAGIHYRDYGEAQRIAEMAAEIRGIDKSALDTTVWRYFRQFKEGECPGQPKRTRLAEECAKLDPIAEQAMAEEGLSEELDRWPEY
jgi:hypothetical protein